MHLPNNHHITHKSTAGSIPLSLFSVFYASENFIKVDQMWCTFKNYKLWSGKKVGKKTYPSPWYNYVRNETALNVWFMTNLYFWKHKSHSAEMALGTRVIFVYLATIIPYLERDPMKKVIKLTFTYNRERLKFHTQ